MSVQFYAKSQPNNILSVYYAGENIGYTLHEDESGSLIHEVFTIFIQWVETSESWVLR